jgi:teichuronic acid biosynthesis glycosyltransferase TuaH
VTPASRGGADVVFTLSVAMLEDAVGRGFRTPPDQTLPGAGAGRGSAGCSLPTPGRSYDAAAARRRSVRTALRVRPYRLRRAESKRLQCLRRLRLGAWKSPCRRSRRAARRQVRGACNLEPVRRCVPRRAVDTRSRLLRPRRLATGERVRSCWSLYREVYARIDKRGAAIFVVSAELAERVSPRATFVPNGHGRLTAQSRCAAANRRASAAARDLHRAVDDRLEASLVELTASAVASVIMIGEFGDPSVLPWLRSIDRVSRLRGGRTARARRDGARVRYRRHPASGPGRYSRHVAVETVRIPCGWAVSRIGRLPRIRGVDDERVSIGSREEWTRGRVPSRWLRPTKCGGCDSSRRPSRERRMRPVVDAAVA